MTRNIGYANFDEKINSILNVEKFSEIQISKN